MFAWTDDNDPDHLVRLALDDLRDAYNDVDCTGLPPNSEAKRRIAEAVITLEYGIAR